MTSCYLTLTPPPNTQKQMCLLCCSVLDLKHAIQAKYKIATQHQVLVVNGGECMVAERRVCSYSAGTVSNVCVMSVSE